MAYTKYSLTPANNTAAPPDGAPEGMLPSAVNDTMRDMMAQIRDVGDGVRDGTYTMTTPKITGGTITGVTLTGNTLTNPVITGATLTTSAFNGTVGATTASTGAFTTLSTSSTTTFSGLTASTALALDASKNVVSVTNTGTGSNVLSASPTLTGTIAGASLSLSSLTSGRVTYAGTAGLLTDSANLLYSGTDLTVYGLTVGRGASSIATNTALGVSALSSVTTGLRLVGLGHSALKVDTTGSYNVAIGYFAAGALTTASGIVAIGDAAMNATTTGGSNTAVGSSALTTNTTGANNTAIGDSALSSNTTASNNTAVGYQAAYTGTTATQVVAIGSGALYANTVNYGTAVGFNALNANTTGAANAAFGAYALSANTTGAGNSAFGTLGFGLSDSALQANTTGSYNSAFGLGALAKNTTASNNTAVGFQAGYNLITSGENTAVGYQALYTNTASGDNVAVGRNALKFATGAGNTVIGEGGGSAITTGAKNTILGRYTGNQGGLDIRTASNYIVLSDGDGNVRQVINGSGNVGINTNSPLQRLDVSSSANEGANVALTKTNSGTADQNGQVLFFNNSHPAGTGRTAGVKCGQLVWQFSQPSSGALQFAGEIAVLAETQGGASTASSLNLYSSGGRGITIDSGTIVSMPAYGAGAATFSASGVISSVSDETWKVKDGTPVNTDAMLQKLEPGYWFYNEEKAPIFGQDRQLGFYAQNVREAIGEEAAPTPEEGKPWGYYDRSVLAVAVMSLKNALNTIEELKQRIETLENK